MKKLIAIPIFVFLLVYLAPGCGNNRTNNPSSVSPPPSAGAPSIVITNIEVRPNPYHLWPASNFKAGDYSVIVSVMNNGTAVCTSSLFFTLKVLKADQYGNFKTSEISIGGATLSDQIGLNETRYVTIPIDTWLTLATAQGDFDTVVGMYKTRLSVVANDPINIGTTIPEPLFAIVKG